MAIHNQLLDVQTGCQTFGFADRNEGQFLL
jgi:hypothetical protein